MKAYKIKYEDGQASIVIAKNIKEVISEYDLASKENINTRIFELSGEQEAIALSEE